MNLTFAKIISWQVWWKLQQSNSKKSGAGCSSCLLIGILHLHIFFCAYIIDEPCCSVKHAFSYTWLETKTENAKKLMLWRSFWSVKNSPQGENNDADNSGPIKFSDPQTWKLTVIKENLYTTTSLKRSSVQERCLDMHSLASEAESFNIYGWAKIEPSLEWMFELESGLTSPG